MSCSDLVLTRESAEDLFPADLVLGEVDLRGPAVSLSRCEPAQGAVRTACCNAAVFGQLGRGARDVSAVCREVASLSAKLS
jgi:hypothetical protein